MSTVKCTRFVALLTVTSFLDLRTQLGHKTQCLDLLILSLLAEQRAITRVEGWLPMPRDTEHSGVACAPVLSPVATRLHNEESLMLEPITVWRAFHSSCDLFLKG